MSDISSRRSAYDRELAGSSGREYKRAFDVALCVVAAPVVAPLILLLALLVKLDGGSAFYGQKRVGRNGKTFTCWKLRTMVPNAEAILADYLTANAVAAAEWELKQKLAEDPRITRIGYFLRKSSLDELPQLFNVLIGDMSLVGPRPMMVEQRSLYSGASYYLMRPGLTGYWQISDRSNSAFTTRVAHDERYYADMSVWTDIKIMFRTVGVLLKGTGV